MTEHPGTKIVTAWVLCSLIIAGGLILTFSPSAAETLVFESAGQLLGEHFGVETSNLGPSPLLLCAMGGLGVICVLINERQRDSGASDRSSTGRRHGSGPRGQHDEHQPSC